MVLITPKSKYGLERLFLALLTLESEKRDNHNYQIHKKSVYAGRIAEDRIGRTDGRTRCYRLSKQFLIGKVAREQQPEKSNIKYYS